MNVAQVAAVILAGGNGGRIGTPKLNLRIGDESSLVRLHRLLEGAGFSPIIVVVEDRFGSSVSRSLPNARVVTIVDPEAPMFESLRAGCAANPRDLPTAVVPVDHPFVQAGTLQTLLQTARQHPDAIIKPVHHGRSGHPVVIPPALIRDVRGAEPGATLRDLIRASRIAQHTVDVDDDGVTKNVNTPNDLEGTEAQ
jgi:molybdenum cofactor cytidylyltransferase